MSDSVNICNADSLAALFDAFNRHDVDGVMSFFADDCQFYTVGGAEVYGNRIDGAESLPRINKIRGRNSIGSG